MNHEQPQSRRHFLAAAAAGGAGLVALNLGRSASALAAGASSQAQGQEEPEITPAEDLMFEHGVIERLLLIYNAAAADLAAGRQMYLQSVASAAQLVRKFAGDYHEKMEEQYVFPRFEKAGKHAELVKVLRTQHDAGRDLTGRIIQLSGDPSHPKFSDLPGLMRSFTAMYFPHISRENSVLFRDLRRVVPPREYDEMGDRFEQIEQERLGHEGYEHALAQVGEIEKQVGINDLAKFTPHA